MKWLIEFLFAEGMSTWWIIPMAFAIKYVVDRAEEQAEKGKKPQKTSKSKKVKAKEFDKYEHMGFFERVKKRVNDQFDERMDELLEHGTPEVRHKNAEQLIKMQLAFEYEELRLEKPLILKIINKPYYEREYTLQDIHGDDHSHYAFIFPEVFDNAYQNGKAVKITWSKLTKKVKENIFENDSFDSFSRVFSQVPYSEFNSQSKVKPKESDRLFKKMNKAKGEGEKGALEVLYIRAIESECNEEIAVLNQKISKARTEKSKENYRKKIAQLKSKITKAFQLKITEEKLNEWGLVDMGDGNYGDGETITHVIEGFGLRRVAKDKQNLSPNIDEPKSASIEDELKKLKSLLEQGLITKKQYEDKTNKLLGL